MINFENLAPNHQHYKQIEKAIRYLVEHQFKQPSLDEVAQAVGMSEFHLQRTFTAWAGISPKQFLQHLTKENAKQKLRESSVLDAALASGLSGPSRLHHLLVTHESITPGEYKTKGAGLTISYGAHSTAFGFCFIAVTPRGICKLAFFDEETEFDQHLNELKRDWESASFEWQPHLTASYCEQLFQRDERKSIPITLKGSPFKLLVWEALLRIPEGQMISYQQLADAVARPNSVRAVASAVANNVIGFLIPCHRVIRSSGAISEYRWGKTRKAALLAWEQSPLASR